MSDNSKRINLLQPIIGVILLIALFIFGTNLNDTLKTYLLAGIMLGYILTRSRYGFAGGIKRIYMRGEGSLTKAILILIALTSIVFMGIQWKAAHGGAIPYYLITDATTQVGIPGTQNVYFTNLATIIGGIIFGIGMMLAGGCGSGTLADFGEGEGRALIAFVFFVIGAAPGQLARYVFDRTTLGKVGARVYLPDTFGYFGALVVTLLLLLFIYYLTVRYENKRKEEGTYLDPLGDYEGSELPLELDKKEKVKFFSYETYHKFFVERWSFVTGSVALAFAALYVMVTAGKAWGVSTPLVSLNVAVFRNFGINFTHEAFTKFNKIADAGLLNDKGTIRNIGLFFGCTVAMLLAGRFKANFSFRLKDGFYFALGGLLLGFGSRFAYGCNIGAMYSAITNFSLSGWVFLIAMSIGGIIGLLLFEGRVCIISNMRREQRNKNKK